MRSNAPIYLVSVPRSGATLLGAMLNSHRSIAMFNEPWFFQMLPKYGSLQRRRNAEMLVDDLSAAAKRFGVLTDKKLKERVLAEVHKLKRPKPLDVFGTFLQLYAEQMGKHRWGVKQPLGSFDVPQMLEYFADLKVIHIVRDPRSTVAYRMDADHDSDENLVDSLQHSRSYTQILAAANRVAEMNSANYFELKYEELVWNPERCLRSLCGFLNEDYDPRMLDYYKAPNPYVPRQENGIPKKTHTDLLSPVHTREVNRWKDHLTLRETAIVEKICCGEMVKREYSRVTSGKEIGPILFCLIAFRLRLRLSKHLLRTGVFERIFHASRKAFIYLFCR